jgi:hypothetical protein
VSIEGFFSIEVNCTYSYVTDKKTIRYYDGEEHLLDSNLNPIYFKEGQIKEIEFDKNLFELMYGGENNENNIDIDTEKEPDAINLTINDTVLKELKEIGFAPSPKSDGWSFAIINKDEDMNSTTEEEGD